MLGLGARTMRVLVLASAAGAVVIWIAMRPADDGLPEKFHFVCVETGEFFDLSIAEAAMIPARNPHTGQRTLVLCISTEDGRWRVAEDHRGILEAELATVNQWVDPHSLLVRPR